MCVWRDDKLFVYTSGMAGGRGAARALGCSREWMGGGRGSKQGKILMVCDKREALEL